ncbi:hypothetical protein BH23PLA1_BH23PLA1_26420 [soil metagenome]
MRVERAGPQLVIEVKTEQETDRLGRAIAEVVGPGTVIGLIGPLGAGKTRLVRALAEGLGVTPESVTSPTYVLIHEYEGRLPVYHFDTYRLNDPDEFDALGAADYLGSAGVCLVEWADRVADRLPAETWILTIEPKGPSSRRFVLEAAEAEEALQSLLARLGIDSASSST